MADEKLRIRIEADAKRAEQDLKTIADLGEELTDDAMTILVDAKTEAAQAEIKQLTKLLADAQDPADIKVITAGITQARDQIDALSKSVEKLDAQKVDIDTSAAKQGIDDVGKSADSSGSVLANMVGNTTQDLGALGGVAGSAGVAIGQMGEYMADAALAGDSLSQILGSFGKVAGPLAVMAGIMQIITTGLAETKKNAEEARARIVRFGDAMAGAADDSLGLTEALQGNLEELQTFADHADFSGPFAALSEGLAGVLESVPGIGDSFKENFDVADVLDRAGISMFEFAREMENGADVSEQFAAMLAEAVSTGRISSKEMDLATTAVEQYGDETAKAREAQQEFNVTRTDANAILQETFKQNAPLEQYTNLWERLFEDMADGTIDTNSSANAINNLSKKLGLTREEVIGLAAAEQERREEEQKSITLSDRATAAIDASADARERAADGARDYADAVASVDFQTDALMAGADAMTDFTDGFFRAGNMIQAQTAAWEGYKETLKDVGHNLDTTTEKGAAQQDALEELAGVVDSELAQAWADAAGDGDTFRTSASKIADTMRTKLTKETNLSDDAIEEVLRHLGLMPDQVETRVQVSGTEEARIKIGLLQGAIDGLPPNVNTKVTQLIIKGDYVGALAEVQRYYDQTPAYVNVKVRMPARSDYAVPDLQWFAPAPTTSTPRSTATTAQRYVNRNGELVPDRGGPS